MTTRLNPTEARAGADRVLTNIAHGYRPQDNFVGLEVAPPVYVSERGGRVLEFDSASFLEQNDRRADGAVYSEIGHGYEGKPYAIDQHGYIHKCGIATYEASKATGVSQDQLAVKNLTQRSALMVEREIVDLVFNPNNYLADRKEVISAGSYWGGDGASSVDPYEAILEARSIIAKAVGSDPTHMVVGREVWDKIITNENLIQHYSQTLHTAITNQILAERFGLEEILVGSATSRTTSTGENKFMWGNFACLFYRGRKKVTGRLGLAANNAYTMADPSTFYTYVYQGHPRVSRRWFNKESSSYCWKIDYDRTSVMPMLQSAFLFIEPVKL